MQPLRDDRDIEIELRTKGGRYRFKLERHRFFAVLLVLDDWIGPGLE